MMLNEEDKTMSEMTREDIIETLEHYYEAAGFKDIKNMELEKMSKNELEKLYKTTLTDSDK